MATIDRFMIAPLNTGLERDVKPWLIPDDAFERLINAYVWRGRVRKRFGSKPLNESVAQATRQLHTRLRVEVGTVGSPDSNVPGTIFKVGQMFSAGTQMFTVNVTGTPAAMLATGPGTGTYNTNTGAFTLSGTGLDPATVIYFYPAEPVMGFIMYEQDDINNEVTYAFDTQFAYTYVGGGWERLGTAQWTGDDSKFFWGTTYRGATNDANILFVTNYEDTNFVKYWDGATWTNFRPEFNAAGDTIDSCRLIVAFKDRLLYLNTIETVDSVEATYVNRCRFSQNGSPLASDAWKEDIPGKGGYLDATTQEAIVTCEFLKDRLIVYFERSTWELVYTGNEILPFRWQKINTELGAESTFSVVPFDKVVLGVGDVGIHACNGANVERIDQKIPDAVFDIQNRSKGVDRTYGIRDYYAEVVYWAIPTFSEGNVYPDRVIVFNYKTGSWAVTVDSITAFGYFYPSTSLEWEDATFEWEEATFQWNSGTNQESFKAVIAGNQEGFTFLLDINRTNNSIALSITNISLSLGIATLTIINHNMATNDYILVQSAQGITNLNDQIYQVAVIDDNTLSLVAATATGTYTGGGVVSLVSQIDILTKQYNFYIDQGRNAYISKIDFLVNATSDGEVKVDTFVSSTEISNNEQGQATDSLLGNGTLETKPYDLVPLERLQQMLWHPVYPQSEGEFVQVHIYLDDVQMRTHPIVFSDFVLNAMTFYATPTTARLQ